MSEINSASAATDHASMCDSVEKARLRRAYRHKATQQLLQLSQQLEPAKAAEIIATIDSASLDYLPHWCLLDEASLLELQRIAGALFVAPALSRCIDGALLNDWRQLLGVSIFDHVLSAAAILTLKESPILPEPSESLILKNGASVLLSTVESHPARPFLEQRFNQWHALVPLQIAQPVYALAVSIFERCLEDQQIMPAQSAASGSLDTAPDSEGAQS